MRGSDFEALIGILLFVGGMIGLAVVLWWIAWWAGAIFIALVAISVGTRMINAS